MGNARIRFRRGRPGEWSSENPVLMSGEPGYEIGTRKMKIGDGRTPWNDLPYSSGGTSDAPVDLTEHITDSTPHPAYDDGPSLVLLYENAKV